MVRDFFFHPIGTLTDIEFAEAYGADGSDPYVSPLLHKKLNQLPKVYLSVCSHDTLRDDGRLFKAALDDAGYVMHLNFPTETCIDRNSVPNLYDEYEGYPHFFWSFPSEHLAEPIAAYERNLEKAFQFVLGSGSKL
jgi:versiconal hemiacetal acetate esterase